MLALSLAGGLPAVGECSGAHRRPEKKKLQVPKVLGVVWWRSGRPRPPLFANVPESPTTSRKPAPLLAFRKSVRPTMCNSRPAMSNPIKWERIWEHEFGCGVAQWKNQPSREAERASTAARSTD